MQRFLLHGREEQGPQSIQTIWINTTKHRSRHRRRGERHGILEWKGVIETLMSRLQSVLLSDFDILIPLYCSTSKLTCFWAIFHRLPLFRRTPVWLGRSSKNKYMDEPESRNHCAIDWLNRSLLKQSAAIIASLQRERERERERRSWLTTILSSVSSRYQVFDVTFIALWVSQWIFPI